MKFLTWLGQTHHRTIATCTRLDLDTWLATGPSTRSLIRTFCAFAHDTRLNTGIRIPHRTARQPPTLTQDQRLAWLTELLTGTSESLPYRVAGTFLLLYAQPLVRVAALQTRDITEEGDQLHLALGKHPAPVPAPFTGLLRQHLENRPNLAAGAGPHSPWLFPSTRAGHHLHPNTITDRLCDLGVNVFGARNRALADLVTEIPPPLIDDALGYSHQVAYKHAQAAAQPWSRYPGHRM